MKRPTSPKKSNDDKRITRMHQMEQMEAAARGTAPSMTLDTSTLNPQHERNHLFAGEFLLAQEQQPPLPAADVETATSSGARSPTRTTSAAAATTTGNFFSQHEKYEVDQSINLMDASSKRYSDADSRTSGRQKRTSFVDIFIGGSGTTSGSGAGKSRGNVTTMWRSSTMGRILVGCVLFAFIALLALSVPYLMIDDPSRSQKETSGSSSSSSSSSSKNNDEVHIQESTSGGDSSGAQQESLSPENAGPVSASYNTEVENDDRFQSLKNVLVDSNVSAKDRLEEETSSAFQALRWLTDEDPAKLGPDDSALVPRFALAALFYATHPSTAHTSNTERRDEGTTTSAASGWAHEDSWMTKLSVCVWFGVECDDKDQAIVHLNMTANRLEGTIPVELSSLSSMRLLYLGSNQLEGTIPDMFDDLHRLTDLQLHGNSLKSQLPATMGKLTSLRRLTLEGNVMSGTLPASWGGMTDLEALELYHNEIVGPIPTEFGEMTSLRNVGLKQNFLQGEIPSELGNLSHLKTLELQYNAIRGKVPTQLGRLEMLEKLDLSNTVVTGSVPSEICELTEEHKLKTVEADCRDEIECSCCTKCS